MAEKEKRRATTFVTSRGAIINVAAPSVYIAPGVTPVDVTSPAELREALREELGWDYIAQHNALYLPDQNAQFTFRTYNPFVTPLVIQRWVDANRALTYIDAEILHHLNYVDGVGALYSKRAFKYGVFGFQARLPDPTDPAFLSLWLGAETTGGLLGGVTSFAFNIAGGAIKTYIYNYSINNVGFSPDISALLPIVPSAGLYNYTVKVNRASVEYYVQTVLVAIVQFAPESDTYAVRTTAPYYLGQVKGQTPCVEPALIEWNCVAIGNIGTLSNIKLSSLWAIDGEPAPPRTLHPITGGVNWKGTIVAGASITSDGIPIAGYKHKTIYFIATGAGTLDISMDYGDNVYDSITPTPLTVVANQLLTYPTENDGLWLKLIYTPTTPPKTITRARVMMSD